MDPLALAAVAGAGLLGSAHCVGMCGGFVALLGAAGERGAAARQAAYLGGKTLTYALFGTAAGALGAGLADAFGALGGVVAVGAGAAMVLAGAALCGVAWGRRGVPGARLVGVLGPAIGRLVASGRPPALVGLGMLNGLLPCGLVYGMLAVAAASGSALGGAAVMAVFGLATAPGLLLAGTLAARLRPAGRLRMQRLAGALVVVMGLLTLARGAQALAPTDDARVPGSSALVCGTHAR